MSAKRPSDKPIAEEVLGQGKRTWVEIGRAAVRHNIKTFRGLINKRVKLWAVVKSNAYGHGLFAFSPLAEKAGVDGFCVDSLVEARALRREGSRSPMLVLGATLPSLLPDAMNDDIVVAVSNFEMLKAVAVLPHPPKFHLKIDTGMHRQGFYPADMKEVSGIISKAGIDKRLEGVFTHFASAKDTNYPAYTDKQFAVFEKVAGRLRQAGYKRLIKHVAATGGTLAAKKYHADAVRVGIGLYGLWPSRELEEQLSGKITLKPVLAWRTVVTEVKHLQSGDMVGYDLTERIRKPTTAAILPIGYWHGFSRALSSVGEILINGQRCRVLGRVSMDMVVADASAAHPIVGDVATIIGPDGEDEVGAAEIAGRMGASHYEVVTRLNPLMERVII